MHRNIRTRKVGKIAWQKVVEAEKERDWGKAQD